MNSIELILNKHQNQIDQIDLEILIASAINKSREFILAHPEYTLTAMQCLLIERYVRRRASAEPLAYIVDYKKFYDLRFEVNKHTLIPRPETELLVDEVLRHLNNTHHCNAKYKIFDIGTGSGNIIISIAKNINKKLPLNQCRLFATDISLPALKIAKQNAGNNNVAKKIKFLHANLLSNSEIKREIKSQHTELVIIANLPYLSATIYASCLKNVKNFEPKTALYSPDNGLRHYERLFQQLQCLLVTSPALTTAVFIEISPEQKTSIVKLIEKYFSKTTISFKKDLAGKWRLCKTIIMQ